MIFSEITFWVSNSKQAASYFITRFGFNEIFNIFDTKISTSICKMNNIFLKFQSPLLNDSSSNSDMIDFLKTHGDGVKDIAFQVDNCEYIYNESIKRGACGIMTPCIHFDNTIRSTIQTSSDITHTFIQGDLYKHVQQQSGDSINDILPTIALLHIDHIVTNSHDMETIVQWYERILKFKRFWSVDETQIHTQYSALRSIVVTDEDEVIKLPINEPAPGLRESQIQEYLNYNNGDGIQHIALLTNDIVQTVVNLRQRGIEFLHIPDKYYDNLEMRLKLSNKLIAESLEQLKKYKILVDFDENGYLLQIFTKPIMSKPTLFIEVIERHNFNGFGAGNFKSLFECIEHEQEKRKH